MDFYHTSEYLAGAAEHSWTSEKEDWLKKQEMLLKESKHKEVLETMRSRLPIDWEKCKSKKKAKSEKKSKENENPLEKCHRYISNRENCLDYKDALEKGLPIGSGEIESAHRYVIQKRLKIAGAWWNPGIAEYMLSLRTLRVNNDWNRYWNSQKAA